jgi:hypothetical protein
MEPWEQEFVRCSKWLEAALEYSGGTHKIEDVKQAIAYGRMQLWPAKTAAIVTEIAVYPRRKTCHVFLCGGDLSELERMAPSIEAFAKATGCDAITSCGRPGWTRSFLKRDGWKPGGTVFAKELGDEQTERHADHNEQN